MTPAQFAATVNADIRRLAGLSEDFPTITFPNFWMFKNEGGWRWVSRNGAQSSPAAFEFAPVCALDAERTLTGARKAPTAPSQIERDAEAYRFLRDAPVGDPDPEAAVLWEELLTKGCRGAIWDKTVAALRELYAAKGWT